MAALLALFCILAQIGPGVSPLAASTQDRSPRPHARCETKPESKPEKVRTPRVKSSPSPSGGPAHKHRIRPSEIRLPPLPKPSPKPPRVRGVKSKPKNTETIVIAPKAPQSKIPMTFVLSKVKAGKLLLQFHSETPGLEFDPSAPFVIQLNPEGSLKVTPSALTRSEWPKNAKQVELSYEGASPSKDNVILGKAAYTVCAPGKKNCRREKTPIVFRFR